MEETSKPSSQEDEGLDEETEAKAKKVLEDYEKQIQHLKSELEKIKADFERLEKEQNSDPSDS
jgi:nuclear pore complex protein Nup54